MPWDWKEWRSWTTAKGVTVKALIAAGMVAAGVELLWFDRDNKGYPAAIDQEAIIVRLLEMRMSVLNTNWPSGVSVNNSAVYAGTNAAGYVVMMTTNNATGLYPSRLFFFVDVWGIPLGAPAFVLDEIEADSVSVPYGNGMFVDLWGEDEEHSGLAKTFGLAPNGPAGGLSRFLVSGGYFEKMQEREWWTNNVYNANYPALHAGYYARFAYTDDASKNPTNRNYITTNILWEVSHALAAHRWTVNEVGAFGTSSTLSGYTGTSAWYSTATDWATMVMDAHASAAFQVEYDGEPDPDPDAVVDYHRMWAEIESYGAARRAVLREWIHWYPSTASAWAPLVSNLVGSVGVAVLFGPEVWLGDEHNYYYHELGAETNYFEQVYDIAPSTGADGLTYYKAPLPTYDGRFDVLPLLTGETNVQVGWSCGGINWVIDWNYSTLTNECLRWYR